MLIKVIYSDGFIGMLKITRLAKLVKMNRIAAYESFDGWVEVRRKLKNPDYQGPERRTYCVR
jgi:hypothetical protein